MAIELYPHQIKAIKDLNNGCVLSGGVGSGKTRTSLVYFYAVVCGGKIKINGLGGDSAPTQPRDIYIITTARKRDELDWQEEAVALRISADRPEESIGGIRMTVDSYNQIHKYIDVEGAFFVFDEQRLVGKGKWVDSFIRIAKKNQWILLSATPGDVWMDYVPIFIANGFFKNRTEFLRNHVVFNRHSKFPKVDRYIDTGILHEYRKRILVDMPFHRETRRHVEYIECGYDEVSYETVTKKRWNIFEEEPIQDKAQVVLLERRVVNSHPSRLEAVEKILEEKNRVIIFYYFNYELEILRQLAERQKVVVAEWNGWKHEPVPINKRWVYLVQYTAGNEAWNCITTDTIIFYSMQYSYKVFEQCQGRIDRMNTSHKDLWYFVLRSRAAIDQQLTKAIRAKENFNLRAYEERYK